MLQHQWHENKTFNAKHYGSEPAAYQTKSTERKLK